MKEKGREYSQPGKRMTNHDQTDNIDLHRGTVSTSIGEQSYDLHTYYFSILLVREDIVATSGI